MVGEEDQSGGRARPFEVDEDIRAFPSPKPVVDDDHVGGEASGLVSGGRRCRLVANNPEAGLAVEDVLDESLKRRRFHRDQDAAILHDSLSDRRPGSLSGWHEARLVTAIGGVDRVSFLGRGGENT